MSIVGFNFTKINAERKNAIVGTVNISNNIQLKDVSEAKLGLGGDRGALRISFAFRSEYVPELASIAFEGDVLILVEQKVQASILEQWKTSKQLPRQIAEQMINHILDRCNIQALLVSKDLNLPSPVPLPKVQVTMPDTPDEKSEEPMKSTKVKKK